MIDWRRGDDENEFGDEESLSDTEADTTEEQRGADSLADTEAEATLVQEDRHSDES
jgi:hypothetical protein